MICIIYFSILSSWTAPDAGGVVIIILINSSKIHWRGVLNGDDFATIKGDVLNGHWSKRDVLDTMEVGNTLIHEGHDQNPEIHYEVPYQGY